VNQDKVREWRGRVERDIQEVTISTEGVIVGIS